MSSTNVHSNGNIHICAGQAIPTKSGMDVPPQNAKKGPGILDIVMGEIAIIQAGDNVTVKADGKIVGRATQEGNILSGDGVKVSKALADRDIGRD